MTGAFIVFGYGSLIFKPPPHVIFQVPGYLKGYVRRFAHKSHDHRGTPEEPGRVVTLIHKEDWDQISGSEAFPDDNIVWGIAYTIDPKYQQEVQDYLDYREKDGYTKEILQVYGRDHTIVIQQAVVCSYWLNESDIILNHLQCYIGRPDNPSFIGSEPLDSLAYCIWRSQGPSGANKEYLYNLAKAIRELAPESDDPHLSSLEIRNRALDASNGQRQDF